MDIRDLDRSIETTVLWWLVAVWRHKIVFVATSVVIFVVIMLAALTIQPVYEGSTLLLAGQPIPEPATAGVPRPPQTTSSLSPIAESEEVVRSAIGTVGLQNLVQTGNPKTASIFSRVRATLFPATKLPPSTLSPTDAWLPRIKSGLSVRIEPNTDIIRIAYRSKDPAIAAEFANAVAQAFIDRQIALYSRPGAAKFFEGQKDRFDADSKSASDALKNFSISAGVYSTDDQRQLLLKRMSDLTAALEATNSAISELEGQRKALSDQLKQLPPVRQSQWVASLVENLSGGRSAPTEQSANAPPINDRIADPALLLVKVYQDSMVSLFKVNADIAGAKGKANQQAEDVKNLTDELNRLAANEEQFVTLKRAVDQAAYNSDIYSKRMVEEQINAASSAAKISSIKVLQAATEPLRPLSPNYVLIFFAAGLVSIIAGVGAAIIRRWLSQRSGLVLAAAI